MANKRLYGSIALSKLKSALMTTKEGTECIVIPIDSNFVHRGTGGSMYLNIDVWINEDEDDYGNIASIKQTGQFDGKKWSDLTDDQQDELKRLPYLGNLKEANRGGNDSSGLRNSAPVPEADLPF